MRQGDKLLYDFAEHGKLAIRITAQHDGHELAVIIPMPETAPKWVPQLLAFTVQETIRKIEATMPEHQSALDADEPGAPPATSSTPTTPAPAATRTTTPAAPNKSPTTSGTTTPTTSSPAAPARPDG